MTRAVEDNLNRAIRAALAQGMTPEQVAEAARKQAV